MRENEDRTKEPVDTDEETFETEDEYLERILDERRKSLPVTPPVPRPRQAAPAQQTKEKPRRARPVSPERPGNSDAEDIEYAVSLEKVMKFPLLPVILAVFIVAVMIAVIISFASREETDVPKNHETNEATKQSQNLNERYDVPDWITVDLLPVNEYSRPGTALEEINGAVVHYVGNAGTSAAQNRSYFAGLAESHTTYASSNFIIGTEGEILLLVPTNEVAYCSNERNYDTLSIETCHPDADGKFTDATYKSMVRLLSWMCGKFGFEPQDIIRHYDITGKECPKYYVDHPELWEQLLEDVAAYAEEE